MGENPDDLESVFESFVIEDNDASPEEEFEVLEVSEEERNTKVGENAYL